MWQGSNAACPLLEIWRQDGKESLGFPADPTHPSGMPVLWGSLLYRETDGHGHMQDGAYGCYLWLLGAAGCQGDAGTIPGTAGGHHIGLRPVEELLPLICWPSLDASWEATGGLWSFRFLPPVSLQWWLFCKNSLACLWMREACVTHTCTPTAAYFVLRIKKKKQPRLITPTSGTLRSSYESELIRPDLKELSERLWINRLFFSFHASSFIGKSL